MRRVIPDLHSAMLHLIPLVDADTDAFNDYMVQCYSSVEQNKG